MGITKPGNRLVAFVTSSASRTLTDDDSLLVRELSLRGVDSTTAAWDDPRVNWGAFGLVVLRSCWNSHLEPIRFMQWLGRLKTFHVNVLNPISALMENVDKMYLLRLCEAGVAIPPTQWVEAGEAPSLTEVMHSRGWDDVVVKPRVSASAYRTRRTSLREAEANSRWFVDQCREGGMLIQQFIPAVVERGELSFMFVGGHYSHAVVKRPASGDFRVQTDFGGTRARTQVHPQLVAQAERALFVLAQDTAYARVDGVVVDETLMIMEIEIIDPVLFLSYSDTAAAAFADAMLRALRASRSIPPPRVQHLARQDV